MLRRVAVDLVKVALKTRARLRSAGSAPVVAEAPVEPLGDAVAEAVAPRPVVRWRTRLASLVVAAGVAVFGLLGALVQTGHAAEPDLALTTGVQQSGHPLLVGVMVLVSQFGFPPLNILLVLAAAVFFWLAGRRTESLFVTLAGVGAGVLGVLLKLVWLRPRPEGGVVRVLGSAPGYSFPSGHTLFYVGFFGFLAYWVFAFLEKGRLRTGLLWLLGLLIVLVGPSRVYLGHHWASDVLAAYALGLAYLLVLIRAYGAARLRTAAR